MKRPHLATALIASAVCSAGIGIMVANGDPDAPPSTGTQLPAVEATTTSSTTATTTSTTVAPVELTVTIEAERIIESQQQITDTLPVPTAQEICNAQVYGRNVQEPAGVCFRAVTAERGWDTARIEAWAYWVVYHPRSVLAGESKHCPNVIGGDLVDANCVIYRHGRGEDTGFGQATRSWWGSDATLCTKHGICSAAQILADPYSSMLWSVVMPIEYDGSGPWCFTRPWNSLKYHACSDAPDR